MTLTISVGRNNALLALAGAVEVWGIVPGICRCLFRISVLPLLGVFGIAVEITSGPNVTAPKANEVTIFWQTDMATSAVVRYGLAPDQLTERMSGGVAMIHRVALAGLKPGVKYFFAVGTARKNLATGEFTTSDSPVKTASSPALSTSALKAPSESGMVAEPNQEVAPPTRVTWSNMATLPDYFARHGADFHAKDADEYARMAWQFGQQAKKGSLQVKVGDDGTCRVYDPNSGAFAAYNADGTTKTYFKSNNPDFFARQPGRLVNVRPP